MKIYFHPAFLKQYAFDPAAEPGRLEPALKMLKEKYFIIEPRAATGDEILKVHSEKHWQSIARDKQLLDTALLAAGSALEAAETALKGEHAFALCRPPGHHASADSCWGFCYFNNLAVAIRNLFERGLINKALIVDFDLHYGDGTANIFRDDGAVYFWHNGSTSRLQYLQTMESDLENLDADFLAVSAGFDRGIDDWGGILTRGDYRTIGSLLGNYARFKCSGRLFAVLEGGYNATALAENIEAFLEGLQL